MNSHNIHSITIQITRFCARVLALGAIVAGGVACSQDDIESALLGVPPGSGGLSPGVLITYPADRATGVSPSDEMWMLFSAEMDQEKTQEAFRLSSGSGTVNGRFRWEGPRMIFTPLIPLSGTSEFVMTAGRQSETADGVDLGDDATVRFFVGADQQRPRFVTSNPVNGATGVPAGDNITVTFSEAVDFSSLSDGITISPSVLFTFTQSTDRTQASLVPASPLTPGTYTVSVTGGIQDLSGNSLQNETTFAFVVGTDFIQPAITAVTTGGPALVNGVNTNGVDRSLPIVIQFSEPMDQTATESAIGLSPFVANTKTWNVASDQLTLTFSPALDSETNYTLTVDATARDTAGNALNQSYSYPFFTNAVASLQPQVSAVVQRSGGGAVCTNGLGTPAGTTVLTNLGVLNTAEFFDIDPGATAQCGLRIELTFQDSLTNPKAMVVSSVATNISWTPIIDPSANSQSIFLVEANPVGVSGSTIVVYIGGNFVKNPGDVPIYRLRVNGGAGGAEDTNGNTLGTNYDLFLSF
ncbi:MAG: Ig-like domain-containing protein [bacterium]|nr:Ig-like domain-containing protein [bacterium]